MEMQCAGSDSLDLALLLVLMQVNVHGWRSTGTEKQLG
jgi:hypothetical protein